jgi:polar amino acid transport system substrate-binding protein
MRYLLVFLACLPAWSAAWAQPEGATIRIATEGAYPPFNYVDQATNEPAGFEVELGRALCEAMQATCTFVVQDWDGMIDALKENRFDAIMSSMEITEERLKRISFSKRYYLMPSALIGPKSAVGEPLADLAGRTVGVVQDSEFAAFLEGSFPNATIRTFGKLEDANLDLLTQRIDFVLGDRLALLRFLGSREGKGCCRFLFEMPVDRGAGIGVGVRRRDIALKERFDRAIDLVQANGVYDAVRAKHFPFDIR